MPDLAIIILYFFSLGYVIWFNYYLIRNKYFNDLISYSEYWYKGKNKMPFIAFLFIIAMTFPTVSQNLYMLLAGISLGGVIIAPGYKDDPETDEKTDKREERFHIIGVVSSIIWGIVSCIKVYENYLYIFLLILGYGIIIFTKDLKQKSGKWAELWSIIIFYYVLFYEHIKELL